MVEPQPSKLVMRFRLPSPALISSCRSARVAAFIGACWSRAFRGSVPVDGQGHLGLTRRSVGRASQANKDCIYGFSEHLHVIDAVCWRQDWDIGASSFQVTFKLLHEPASL